MNIQICLVSDQAAANLLPALDPDLRPGKIILLVTSRMKSRGEALEKVLREAGVAPETVILSDEHDLEKLRSEILELAGRLSDEVDVCLNLTGGTKLMALAAQGIGETADWRAFYVDADTGEAIWLAEPQNRQSLAQHLRLPHYLGGYGFSIERNSGPAWNEPRYQRLLDTLVSQVGNMTQALGQSNWIAQQAESRRSLRIGLTEQQLDSVSLQALLRNFSDAGVLAIENDHVVFASDADRAFVKGGWLEYLVFRTLSGLGHELGIRDKASNLEVTDVNGVRNELDTVFLARNRLHIIECKTARMDRPEAPRANDTLFKLAEIGRRVGGLATRTLLVSYRKLGQAECKLARALNVEVISAGELRLLGQRIRDWVL